LNSWEVFWQTYTFHWIHEKTFDKLIPFIEFMRSLLTNLYLSLNSWEIFNERYKFVKRLLMNSMKGISLSKTSIEFNEWYKFDKSLLMNSMKGISLSRSLLTNLFLSLNSWEVFWQTYTFHWIHEKSFDKLIPFIEFMRRLLSNLYLSLNSWENLLMNSMKGISLTKVFSWIQWKV
jgi:hypothetical protein